MPYLTDAERSVRAEVTWCELVDMDVKSTNVSCDRADLVDSGEAVEEWRRECGQERVEWVRRFM
jgi:hypothetical protein